MTPSTISRVVIIGLEFKGVLVSGIIAMNATIATDNPFGYPSSARILLVISSAAPSPNMRIPVIASVMSTRN